MNTYEIMITKDFCRAYNITLQDFYVQYCHVPNKFFIKSNNECRKFTKYIPFNYKGKEIIFC